MPDFAAPSHHAQEEDWRKAHLVRQAAENARKQEAKRNRVYVAMGPIIGAVLIANLITAVVWAILYSIVK